MRRVCRWGQAQGCARIAEEKWRAGVVRGCWTLGKRGAPVEVSHVVVTTYVRKREPDGPGRRGVRTLGKRAVISAVVTSGYVERARFRVCVSRASEKCGVIRMAVAGFLAAELLHPLTSRWGRRGGSHRGLCVCDAQRKSSHLQTCFGDNVGWQHGRFGIFLRNPGLCTPSPFPDVRGWRWRS